VSAADCCLDRCWHCLSYQTPWLLLLLPRRVLLLLMVGPVMQMLAA
jgi:hypothetical protein